MSEERTLKQRIHDGDALNIGWASLTMSRDDLVARLSQDEYDLVFVDAQHAPYNEHELIAFCNVAAEVGVPPLLRIRHTKLAFLAGNYADLGPLGILVPMVERVATIEEAVENFYYPPLGKRSWGPIHGYGRDIVKDRVAYGAWWNEHGILALQIETVEGVANARALAVPGLDLVLFGGNDLSFSLAAHPDSPYESVEDCCRHVVDATKGTGVRVASGFLPYGSFEATR
ncbi:MAG: aldolase/citrate lyase family protein [Anaerolineae bacterium]